MNCPPPSAAGGVKVSENRENPKPWSHLVKKLELSPTPIESRVVHMLRAIANPARFHIVGLLAERKDCPAGQLAEMLPLAQSSLSDHLAALRDAGIVQVSGEGPNRYYCVEPTALEFLAAHLGGLADGARKWAGLVETVQREDGMEIRDANHADAPALAHIYNQGIEDRVATLETDLRTPDERAEWLGARGGRHPVLAAVNGAGAVVGWGSLNPFNPRPAYDHVVDFSVYVAREHRGRGVGDALLGALEGRARSIGYHKMVLAAFPTNAPGMRLYERHGFLTVGVYHEQGMLDGHWVDVIVMEKVLG